MSHVDPHANEKAEIGTDKRMVEIVQCFTRRQEEVRNIVCHEYRQPNPGEVVAIAHPNKRQGDDMVHHELFKVLTRLLKLEKEDDALLQPVRGL